MVEFTVRDLSVLRGCLSVCSVGEMHLSVYVHKDGYVRVIS